MANKGGSFKKEANPYMKFLKATSSHLGGAVNDIIKEYTPNTSSLIDDAKDLFQESKKATKETSGNLLTKVKETFRLQTFRNIFNWYTNTGDSFGFSIEDDDMSDLSFDIEDRSATTSSFVKEEKKQTKTTLSEMNRNSDKIASTVLESNKKLAEVQVASLSSMTNMLEKTNSIISAGFEKVNASIRDLIKVVTENTNSIIKVVSIGKQADSNTKSSSSNNEFNYKKLLSGNFSFKDYFKHALSGKNALNSLDSSGSLAMFDISDLKMVYDTMKEAGGAGLVSMILSNAVEGLFPSLKKSITSFDSSLKTMFANTVRDLGRGFIFGQKLPDNWFGKLLGGLGMTPDYYSFNRIQKSSFEHKTISFDSETKESIVKVIPEYLREILKAVSKEDKYYDLKAGSLRSVNEINRDFQMRKANLMSGKNTRSYVWEMSSYLSKDDKEKLNSNEKLQFILNQFLKNLYRRINREAEDAKTLLLEYGSNEYQIKKKLKEQIGFDKLPKDIQEVFDEEAGTIARFIIALSSQSTKVQSNAYSYQSQYNDFISEQSQFYKNQAFLNVMQKNDTDEDLLNYEIKNRAFEAKRAAQDETLRKLKKELDDLDEKYGKKHSISLMFSGIGKKLDGMSKEERAKYDEEIKNGRARIDKIKKEIEKIEKQKSLTTFENLEESLVDENKEESKNEQEKPKVVPASQAIQTSTKGKKKSKNQKFKNNSKKVKNKKVKNAEVADIVESISEVAPNQPINITVTQASQPVVQTENPIVDEVLSTATNKSKQVKRQVSRPATTTKRVRNFKGGLKHVMGPIGRTNMSFFGLDYLYRGLEYLINGEEVEVPVEENDQSLEPQQSTPQQSNQSQVDSSKQITVTSSPRRGMKLYSSIGIPIPPDFMDNLFGDKNKIQQQTNQATQQTAITLKSMLLGNTQSKNPNDKNNDDPSILDKILGTAIGGVGGGILGGPFGLIIGAILGSSYPIAKVGKGINDFLFGDLFNKKGDPNKPKMGFIEEQLFNMFIPFKLEFQKTKDFFIAHFKRSVLGEFKAIYAGIKGVIANGIKRAQKSWLGKAWKWIADSPLGKFIGGVFKFPFKVMGGIAKWVWTLISRGIPGLIGGGVRSVIGLGSAGARIGGGILGMLGGAIGGEEFTKAYKESKKESTDQFNKDIGKSGYHLTDAAFEALQGNLGYGSEMFKNKDQIDWALIGSKQDREYITKERQKWLENRNKFKEMIFGQQTADNTNRIAESLDAIRTGLGIKPDGSKDNKEDTNKNPEVTEAINQIKEGLGLPKVEQNPQTTASESGKKRRGIRLYSSIGVPISPDFMDSWFIPKEESNAEETGEITKQAIINTMDSARDEVNSGEISKEQAATTLNRITGGIKDPKTQADAKAATKVTLLSMTNVKRKPTESEKKKSLFDSIFEFLNKSLVLPSWLKTAGIILATLPMLGITIKGIKSLLETISKADQKNAQEIEKEKQNRERKKGTLFKDEAAIYNAASLARGNKYNLFDKSTESKINDLTKKRAKLVEKYKNTPSNKIQNQINDIDRELADIEQKSLMRKENLDKKAEEIYQKDTIVDKNLDEIKQLEKAQSQQNKLLAEEKKKAAEGLKIAENDLKNGTITQEQYNKIKSSSEFNIESIKNKKIEIDNKLENARNNLKTSKSASKTAKIEYNKASTGANAKAIRDQLGHTIQVRLGFIASTHIVAEALRYIFYAFMGCDGKGGEVLSKEKLNIKNTIDQIVDSAEVIGDTLILFLPHGILEAFKDGIMNAFKGAANKVGIVIEDLTKNTAKTAGRQLKPNPIVFKHIGKWFVLLGKRIVQLFTNPKQFGKFLGRCVKSLIPKLIAKSVASAGTLLTAAASGIWGALDWHRTFGILKGRDYDINDTEIGLMGAISALFNALSWSLLPFALLEFLGDSVLYFAKDLLNISYDYNGHHQLPYAADNVRMWCAWNLYIACTLPTDRTAFSTANKVFQEYSSRFKSVGKHDKIQENYLNAVAQEDLLHSMNIFNQKENQLNRLPYDFTTHKGNGFIRKNQYVIDEKTGKVYINKRLGERSVSEEYSKKSAKAQGFMRDHSGNIRIFGDKKVKNGNTYINGGMVKIDPFDPDISYGANLGDKRINEYFNKYYELLDSYLNYLYEFDKPKFHKLASLLVDEDLNDINTLFKFYHSKKIFGSSKVNPKWKINQQTNPYKSNGLRQLGTYVNNNKTYNLLIPLRKYFSKYFNDKKNINKFPSDIIKEFLIDDGIKNNLNSTIANLKNKEILLFKDLFNDTHELSEYSLNDLTQMKQTIEKQQKERALEKRQAATKANAKINKTVDFDPFGGPNDYKPTERIKASNAFFHRSKSNGMFSNNWDPFSLNESTKAINKTFLSDKDMKRFYKYKTPIMVPLDERLKYQEAYKLYTYNYYNNKAKGNATIAQMLMQSDQATDPFGSSFGMNTLVGTSMKDTMKEINNVSFKNPLSNKKKNGFYASPLGDYPLTITSKFGPRKLNGADDMHTGIDLGAPGGTKITAPSNGIVVDNAPTAVSAGYGNFLAYLDESGKMFMGFGHMKEPSPLHIGDPVTKGQTIGLVGNTGHSFGDHLHFEVVKRPNEKASKNYWANWGGKRNLDTFYNPEDIINNRDLDATYNYDYQSGKDGSMTNEELENTLNEQNQSTGLLSIFENSPLGKLFGLFGKFFGGVSGFNSKKSTNQSGISTFGNGRFTPEEAKNNRDRIYMILRNKGFSPEAAIGILANIYAESSFSTTVISGDGYGSVGICQWTDDRKTNLFNFAKRKGKDPSDIEVQTEFLLYELNQYPALMALKNTNDSGLMAEQFCRLFERPANVNLRVNQRRQYASELTKPLMELENSIQIAGASKETVNQLEKDVNSKSTDKVGGALISNPNILRNRYGRRSSRAFSNILNSQTFKNNKPNYYSSSGIFAKLLKEDPKRIVKMKPSRQQLIHYGLDDENELMDLFTANIDQFNSWTEADWKKAGFNMVQVKYMQRMGSNKFKSNIIKYQQKSHNIFSKKPNIPQITKNNTNINIQNPSDVIQSIEDIPIDNVPIKYNLSNTLSIEQKLDTLIILLTEILKSSQKNNGLNASNTELLGKILNMNNQQTNDLVRKVNQNYIPNRYLTQTNPYGIPQIIIG